MFNSISILLLLIVSLISIEARNLASNNGFTFSVDLIRRDEIADKSHKRGILGSISSNHHFHLSSTYYDKMDNSFSTEIIPDGGAFLMKMAIGTPPVEFTGVADTGSDLVWVQCSPCKHCIRQKLPLFDPTKSSTYKPIPCNSDSCYLPYYSGCSNGSCAYEQMYGDGSSSVGALATDTFTFSSNDNSTNFPSSIFGCGFDQQGKTIGSHRDGIFGLGNGPLSLVSQLGSSINHRFSYCLTPSFSGINSKLRFGSSVNGPKVVSTPFITKTPLNHYHLTLKKITIGDRSIPVGQDVIIDSGTTLTYLETSVYSSIKTAMKGAIELSSVPDPNKIFDPCYKVPKSGVGFNPPDVVFGFKGADILLKAVNTFWRVGKLTCLAIAPTNNTFIFGNIAQINFEVGYDLPAKQVSFAPADCTKY